MSTTQYTQGRHLMKIPVACVRYWLGISTILAAACIGQPSAGSITGILTNPAGQPVAGSRVEVRDSTGQIHAAASTRDGRFSISGLPASTYELTVPFPCCTHSTYQQKGIALTGGQTRSLEIHIQWGNNLGTLGDDPLERLADIRSTGEIPVGATPRMPDGHPDLNGIWLPAPYPNQPSPTYLPSAAALLKNRGDDNNKEYPANYCLPPNPMTFTLNFPIQIVQTPTFIVLLQEFVPVAARQIFMDGRPHPADPNPTWLGHSIGTWDGDTLVIDSVGFNDKTWLSNFGIPHTEQMHTVERLRRVDLGHLEIEVIIEDPGAFSAAWKRKIGATLAPKGESLLEYVCTENNKDALHIVGK